MENQVGFSYKMLDKVLMYIVSSRPLEEDEGDDMYEEIEGLYYEIHWGKRVFPFSFPTQEKAMIAAMSIQWGANNVG